MRVVQHKKEPEKAEQPQMTPEDEEEFGTRSSLSYVNINGHPLV